MKLWTLTTSFSLLLLILSGCNTTPKPADKEKAVIDVSLPSVALTKNGIILGMKGVAFEWKSITDPKVKGIYVYKKSPSTDNRPNELSYYHTIKSRFSTHYVDTNVEPDMRYSYAFKTFSDSAEGKLGKEIVVNTLPVIKSVSWIHSITGMPRVAKIIWRPHSNANVKSYIVERKTLEDEDWRKIDTIRGRLNAEYIDEELKDNFVYMYRLRAVTYDGIVSTPSQIVKVVTKALPKPITNLSATKNLANKIVLNWDVSTQKDFALYYLYRSEDIDGGYELIAKLHNNTFTDKIQEHGKSYFYKVTAVDKDGLESSQSRKAVLGMTLSRPEAPLIVEAKRVGSSIKILWEKTDPRSISFNVLRVHKKGWFDETSQEFTGIKENKFLDRDIESDSTYTYFVYSVDKNGIKSNESVAVRIIIPEDDKLLEVKNTKKNIATKNSTVTEEKIVAPSENLDLSGL